VNLCHEERTTVREKELEKKMVRAVRRCGGLALKFVSPGIAGVPDRIVLLPGGRLVFAEMKAPGEKPGALQAFRHEQLRKLGFRVVVVDSTEKIGEMLNEICSSCVPDVRDGVYTDPSGGGHPAADGSGEKRDYADGDEDTF
jgi:hypothetical protein